MSYPAKYRYTREHEWIEVNDGIGRVGITDYAQKQLGDIVYVDLPRVGAVAVAGQPFGTVESVKAVSDLCAAVSGEIVEVNEALKTSPERVNADAHGEGWIARIRISDPNELSSLMDALAYDSFVGTETAGPEAGH